MLEFVLEFYADQVGKGGSVSETQKLPCYGCGKKDGTTKIGLKDRPLVLCESCLTEINVAVNTIAAPKWEHV